MKVTVHMPTRSRPDRALRMLEQYRRMASKRHQVTLSVVVDDDDESMRFPWVQERLRRLDVRVHRGTHTCKVQACNAGIDRDFDVLLLASDDMTPVESNWDNTVLQAMVDHFPNLDGALHFNDGHVGDRLCTFPIVGVNLHKKMGHIYHPDYKSLWCVPGESLVYMADQTLKPIRDVKPGDVVVGTAELLCRGKLRGPRNKLAPATVTEVHTRRAPIVKVTLASGAVIRCTADHRWAYYGEHRRVEAAHYGEAKLGRRLMRVHAMPGKPPAGMERELGWIAGMYDGEGTFPSIVQSKTHNPATCAELERVLKRLGFNVADRGYDRSKWSMRLPKTDWMCVWTLVGGRDEYLKFLEWVRPVRNATRQVQKRMFTARFGRPDEIVSIEPDGEEQVYCITTTSGNFVVEGLLSHNCDNEWTDLLRSLKRLPYFRKVLFRHDHFSFGGIPVDDLYRRNEALRAEDEVVYRRREALRAEGSPFPFGWPQVRLSILIASLRKRTEPLRQLMAKLNDEINAGDLCPEVEMVVMRDEGAMPIGAKRRALLERSVGSHIAFIDDDDLVAPDYCRQIIAAIRRQPDLGCIGFVGEMTTDGGSPRRFTHAMECGSWYEKNGEYFRTPNHLNPVRRDLAVKAGFGDERFGEDKAYSDRLYPILKASGAPEVMFGGVAYHYRYNTRKP